MKKNYLALGGIFASIHLLFVLSTLFLVGSELVLIVFLPLLSALYFLKTGWKETLTYVIATFLICLIFNPIYTVIYVLPSLLIGSFYGFLCKNKFKQLEIVYLTSIVHFITLVVSVFFIGFLVDLDILSFFRENFSFYHPFLPISLVLIVLAFMQSFLTHIVISNELTRFGYKVSKEEKTPFWFLIAMVFSTLLFSLLRVLNNEFDLILILFITVFAIPFLVEGAVELKYKVFTYIGFVFTITISTLLLGLIDPLYFPLIVLFLLSPLTINIEI